MGPSARKDRWPGTREAQHIKFGRLGKRYSMADLVYPWSTLQTSMAEVPVAVWAAACTTDT